MYSVVGNVPAGHCSKAEPYPHLAQGVFMVHSLEGARGLISLRCSVELPVSKSGRRIFQLGGPRCAQYRTLDVKPQVLESAGRRDVLPLMPLPTLARLYVRMSSQDAGILCAGQRTNSYT